MIQNHHPNNASAIRVVVPAYKTGKEIKDCIHALSNSSIKDALDIVVVDNGLNPDLANNLKNYHVTILKRDEINSAAYARNCGASGFQNGILVFLDSDVICENDTIQKLIEPIQQGACVATVGSYSANITGLTFAQKYKQLYLHYIYGRKKGLLKNEFWTAIGAIQSDVFEHLHGFDNSYKGANGEDQELGIRLTEKGYRVHAVPSAKGQHRSPYTVASIVRNDFKKGVLAVYQSRQNNFALSDNRHASFIDKLATLSAGMIALSLFISLLFPWSLVVSFLFTFIWCFSRQELIQVYSQLEYDLFVLRAVMFMLVLDGVRILCVIAGIGKSMLSRFVKSEEKISETYTVPQT